MPTEAAPKADPKKPCLCCGQFPQATVRSAEGVCTSCAFWIDAEAADAADKAACEAEGIA